ncbi:MAG: hypothetical protein ACTSU5_15160 [Promethearchaeota archaeon]
MYRPSRIRKKELVASVVTLAFFVFALSLSTITSRAPTPFQVTGGEEVNGDGAPGPLVPRAADDGQVHYRKGNENTALDDDFSTIYDGNSSVYFNETYDPTNRLSWEASPGRLHFVGIFGATHEKANASGSHFEFTPCFGTLHFTHQASSVDAVFYVWVYDGNTGAATRYGPYNNVGSYTTDTIDLNGSHPAGSQFDITFEFDSRDNTDDTYIDRIWVTGTEFVWEEINGPTYEYDASVGIRLHIVPANYSLNRSSPLSVRLYYTNDAGDTDLANAQIAVPWPSGSPGNYNYTFTISNTFTEWGKDLRYKMSYDSSGTGSNWINSSVFDLGITDTQQPSTLNEGSGNTDSVNYNETKFLNFTIRDDSASLHPSDIDSSTLELQYSINDAGFGSPTTLGSAYFTSRGDHQWRVPIVESAYSWGDTVYYRVRVSDNAGNGPRTFSSSSFTITDNFNPHFLSREENFSGAVGYEDDVSINITASDWAADASNLSQVLLFVRNGSAPTHSGAQPTGSTVLVVNSTNPFNQVTTKVEFIINSTCLSAKYDLYWVVWMVDRAGREVEGSGLFAGSFTVQDLVPPEVRFDYYQEEDKDGFPGQVSYDEGVYVYFTFTEPEDGLGFSALADYSLRLYYNVTGESDPQPQNASAADNPNDPIYPIGWFIDPGKGGQLSFYIPETLFTINQRVWFWVNASDAHPNNATSFVAVGLQNFTVVDKNAPVFQDIVANDVSYYQDQTVTFKLTKGTEGCTIHNFTVFIDNNSGVSNTVFDTYISYNSTNWTTPYVVEVNGKWELQVSITFLHDDPTLMFRYGETYYLFFQAFDDLHNQRNLTRSFHILDQRLPVASASTENSYGTVFSDNKLVKVTTHDPDYSEGFSSGISTVRLYLKNGSDTVSTSDYHESQTYSGPSPSGGTFEFSIFTNGEKYWATFEKISIIFVITDAAGNSYITPVQTFKIDVTVTATVVSPAGMNDETTYYTNQTDFTVSISLNFPCAAWYSLDDGPVKAIDPSEETTRQFSVSLSGEGTHTIRFYYYIQDTEHAKVYTVVYDVTPPRAVTIFKAVVSGKSIVLTWDAVQDAQPVRYVIYKSTSEGTLGECVAGCDETLTTTTFQDFAIQTGHTYYYTIIVVDSAGNISQATTISLGVPLPTWIWFVAIGAAVAGLVGIVVKVRASHNRSVLADAFVKAPEVDETLDEEDISAFVQAARSRKQVGTAPKEAAAEGGWTSITMGHAVKQKTTRRLSRIQYWKKEGGKLISQAMAKEKLGEIQAAIRRYEIIERSAHRTNNVELQALARNKILELAQRAYYK